MIHLKCLIYELNSQIKLNVQQAVVIATYSVFSIVSFIFASMFWCASSDLDVIIFRPGIVYAGSTKSIHFFGSLFPSTKPSGSMSLVFISKVSSVIFFSRITATGSTSERRRGHLLASSSLSHANTYVPELNTVTHGSGGIIICQFNMTSLRKNGNVKILARACPSFEWSFLNPSRLTRRKCMRDVYKKLKENKNKISFPLQILLIHKTSCYFKSFKT